MAKRIIAFLHVFRLLLSAVILIILGLVFFSKPSFSHLLVPQFFPSLIAALGGATVAAIIAVLFIIILTFLIGRVYCSFICPWGALQDCIAWVVGLRSGKFKKSPALVRLRYIWVIFLSCLALSGVMWPLGFFEPYSFFGRLIAEFSDLQFYQMGGAIVLGLFFIFVIVVALKGRIFCNSLCPVGAILGFIAKFSLFRIIFITDACPGCSTCEKVCKVGCIDIKKSRIDFSRCIMCLNCLTACPMSSIVFRFAWFHHRHHKEQKEHFSLHESGIKAKNRSKISEEREENNKIPHPIHGDERNSAHWAHKNKQKSSTAFSFDKEKRNFLLTLGGSALAGIAVSRLLKGKNTQQRPVMPPGAKNLDHFLSSCTACHLCISQCPTGVIKSSLKEYGLTGVFTPHLAYDQAQCDFNCNICSNVCPTNALQPLTLAQKQQTKIGRSEYFFSKCIVPTRLVACGLCATSCPTGAICMIKWRHGLSVPQIDQAACIGCGACQRVCPAIPQKAMIVRGVSEQKNLT